jgi:hypothetical protein
MIHTGTVNWTFLNKHAQPHLKPALALVVKMSNVKYYHILQNLKMNLSGVQRRKQTTKPLQFLELMKAVFDCGGNIRQ